MSRSLTGLVQESDSGFMKHKAKDPEMAASVHHKTPLNCCTFVTKGRRDIVSLCRMALRTARRMCWFFSASAMRSGSGQNVTTVSNMLLGMFARHGALCVTAAGLVSVSGEAHTTRLT